MLLGWEVWRQKPLSDCMSMKEVRQEHEGDCMEES